MARDPFELDRPRRGGTGNVIAAVASAILPGVGQLAQGRTGPGLFFLVAATVLWILMSICCVPVAVVVHIWACLDAALWEPT